LTLVSLTFLIYS